MNSLAVTKQMLIDVDISLGTINNSPLIAQLKQDRNAIGNSKPKECRAEAERVIRALRKDSKRLETLMIPTTPTPSAFARSLN
jgi:hypothetical protein